MQKRRYHGNALLSGFPFTEFHRVSVHSLPLDGAGALGSSVLHCPTQAPAVTTEDQRNATWRAVYGYTAHLGGRGHRLHRPSRLQAKGAVRLSVSQSDDMHPAIKCASQIKTLEGAVRRQHVDLFRLDGSVASNAAGRSSQAQTEGHNFSHSAIALWAVHSQGRHATSEALSIPRS